MYTLVRPQKAKRSERTSTYLLDRDDLLGLVVDGLVDSTEAAGTEFLQQRVLTGGIVARYRGRF
jgi:hypothetical protein